MRQAKSYLMPPPPLTVSEWADTYRIISQANAEPGKWRTSRAPYQKEPMDCISDPKVYQVTAMWGAQVGKTDSLINNAIGYYIHQDPKSIMVMHPTQTDLNTWIEAKLNPLIEETPEIKERVAAARSREGVNNKTMKSYYGGFLMFSWSGSPNTMRGRSSPIILCDEVDGYEYSQEGDPIQLLWQRSATFGDQRKLIVTSTPTIKGHSRVESSYEASDKRRYQVPCLSCNEMQVLKWEQVKWDKDANGEHDPSTARYECKACGHPMTDNDKILALKRGRWVAEKPFKGHAGFHISELYSPFRRWQDIVQSFLDKKAAGDLMSFVNVSLGETWEETGESANDEQLYNRREDYEHEVPDGYQLLTCGVDVQQDRLELEVVAWNSKEQSANIDYRVIYGDPDDSIDDPEGVWQALDDYLSQSFQGSEKSYKINACCIDSGGSNTSKVYEYCRHRRKDRIFAIKGRGGEGVPLVSNPLRRKSGREKRKVDLYTLGVDGIKLTIMRRLQIQEPKLAGYCRFPMGRDEEYFKQLTAEKMVTRYKQGQAVRSWIKPNTARNEALDCRVYAYAALKILNPAWGAIENRKEPQPKVEEPPAQAVTLKAKPIDEPTKEAQPATKPRRRRARARKRFATGW